MSVHILMSEQKLGSTHQAVRPVPETCLSNLQSTVAAS